jgi:hypothetical protein
MDHFITEADATDLETSTFEYIDSSQYWFLLPYLFVYNALKYEHILLKAYTNLLLYGCILENNKDKGKIMLLLSEVWHHLCKI